MEFGPIPTIQKFTQDAKVLIYQEFPSYSGLLINVRFGSFLVTAPHLSASDFEAIRC
jgi:hypothetical protein